MNPSATRPMGLVIVPRDPAPLVRVSVGPGSPVMFRDLALHLQPDIRAAKGLFGLPWRRHGRVEMALELAWGEIGWHGGIHESIRDATNGTGECAARFGSADSRGAL